MRPPKQRRHSTGNPHIQRLGSQLREAAAPQNALSRARDAVDPALFSDLVTWLGKQALLSRQLFNPAYPRSFAEIAATRPLGPTDPAREVRWARAYLSPHFPNLRRFVGVSDHYQLSLLSGDYERAARDLDTIEEEFGQSLWLIRNRIAFLQMTAGLQPHKQYVRSLKSSLPGANIIAYIAHYVSERNEPTVSGDRFLALYEHHLSTVSIPRDVAAYLRFHILGQMGPAVGSLMDVLRLDGAGPVIDYYEALIAVLCQIDALGLQDLLQSARRTAARVHRATGDARLSMLIFCLGGRPPERLAGDEKLLPAVSDYIRGSSPTATAAATRALQADASQFDTWWLLSTCPDPTIEPSPSASSAPSHVILRQMSTLRQKLPGSVEAAAELTKIALNLRGYPWSAALQAFVMGECSTDADPAPTVIDHVANVMLPWTNPLRARAFRVEAAQIRYLGRCDQWAEARTAVQFARAELGQSVDAGSLDQFGEDARNYIAALNALRDGDTDSARTGAESLRLSRDRVWRLRGINLLAHALLRSGSVRDCLWLVVEEYLADPGVRAILPLRDLVDQIPEEAHAAIRGDITVPIAYDLYARYIASSADAERSDAYEDFLDAHGVDRPSRLGPSADRFPRPSLVYFMRFVCVESVMDRSTAFDRSAEVASERETICRLLIQLDPSNESIYQNEITTIVRRLTVQRRLQQVEQSKVYVDIEGIRQTLDPSLQEPFRRYLSLREDGLTELPDVELAHAVRAAFRGRTEHLLQLAVPRDESSAILQGLLEALRDQFVANSEYGLDGYLSVRIRHGTLAAQLRRPLEAHKLITQRDAVTGEYRANAHWLSELRPAPCAATMLATAMAEFSRSFDALAEEIRTKWIQIKRRSEDEGWFDFAIYPYHVRGVAEETSPTTSFEAFCDNVFDSLAAQLWSNLRTIQERFREEANQRILQLLLDLQHAVEDAASTVDVRPLLNAIAAARTDAPVAVSRVAQWFAPPGTSPSEPFPLEDALETAATMVRAAAPSFAIHAEDLPDTPLVLPGSRLNSFVDIFYILFENVVRHSQADVSSATYVCARLDAGWLVVQVSNNLGADVDTASADKRLQAIRKELDSERYLASAVTEGGTGFFKVCKILRQQFGTKSCVDFRFTDDQRFEVVLRIAVLEVGDEVAPS